MIGCWSQGESTAISTDTELCLEPVDRASIRNGSHQGLSADQEATLYTILFAQIMGFSFFFISFFLSSFFLFFLEMFLMLLSFDCNLRIFYLLSRLSVREPTYLCHSYSFSLYILHCACLSVCRWVWLICQIARCFCIYCFCMFVCCFCVCLFFSCFFYLCVCFLFLYLSVCSSAACGSVRIPVCLCVWLAVDFACVYVSGCF